MLLKHLEYIECHFTYEKEDSSFRSRSIKNVSFVITSTNQGSTIFCNLK